MKASGVAAVVPRVNSTLSVDFDSKGVEWALRIAPHYFNTTDEVGSAVAAIGEILKR